MTDLLQIRRKLKSKKPTFLRQDAHRLHLPKKWTRPRGIHNKMRLKIKGHRIRPSTGFGSPRKIKNTLRSGLLPLIIKNKAALDTINTKTQTAMLSSTLGKKKRLEILEYSLSKNIIIYNVKDPKQTIEKIKQEIQNRKKQAVSTQEKKKLSKQEALKKAQEKQEHEKQPPQEEKKEEIKLEQEALEKQQIHEHSPKIEQKIVSDKIAKKDQVRSKIPAGGDRSAQHK